MMSKITIEALREFLQSHKKLGWTTANCDKCIISNYFENQNKGRGFVRPSVDWAPEGHYGQLLIEWVSHGGFIHAEILPDWTAEFVCRADRNGDSITAVEALAILEDVAREYRQ